MCMELLELYLNSETHKVLSLDLKEKMLNHAYLINSKDDVLLQALGFFAVKEIFCESDNKPCDKCTNCQKIEHSNMVDLEIYPKDNASLVVDDILNIVQSAYVKPMESEYKVFLLNNFDECTVQGQNKILKTIEEPPQNVIFILTAKNMGLVLPTILSRSKKIVERNLPNEIVEKFLIDRKVDNAKLISSMSSGNLGTAIKIAENKDSVSIINLCISLLQKLNSSKDILLYSSSILQLKKDIPFFLDTLITMLRDISIFGKEGNIYFQNFQNDYEALSKIYNSRMIEKIMKEINQVYEKIEANCNMTAVVDQLLLKILEVKFLWQK